MFALKKILGTLLSPVSGGMLFLLLALVLLLTKRFQRLGRALLVVGLPVAYVLGTSPTADYLIGRLERRHPALQDPAALDTNIRWVIVLGGGHVSDEDVVASARLVPEALYRLTEGIRIHRALPGSSLVLSGYGGADERSTAEAMLDAAMAMGIDSARMRLHTGPRDTGEEAERVRAIVQPGERFVLVTSAAHMPRAMYHFRARGLGPIPAPAQAYALSGAGGFGLRDLLPAATNYLKVERAVYETLGLIWARMTVRQ